MRQAAHALLFRLRTPACLVVVSGLLAFAGLSPSFLLPPFLLVASVPAMAGQDSPRLDALFERLRVTEDRSEAAAIEQRIWHLWMDADQEDLNLLMRQGTRALAERDIDTARESFDALITLAPNLAEAWNQRATLFYMSGQYDASLADIRQTLALEPRHFGAITGLGMVYEALGDEEAALQAYREGLKVNPHMSQVREKMSELQRRLRDRRI